MEQEKSSRIRLTLTRKESSIYSESENTDLDDGSVEIHPSEVALPETSASHTSAEILEVPCPHSPKDHIKHSTRPTPYDREFIGPRRESEIVGLAGGQPAIETNSPIILDGQSMREIGTSNLIQPSHSEPPNGLKSQENSTSGPSTVFLPRSTTQPLPTRARPNVTFTSRPDSFEPSTLGKISSALRPNNDANNGRKDTNVSAGPQRRGSTGYPSVVRLGEESRYPPRSNGEYHYNSRPVYNSAPLHHSARSFMYDEDDVLPRRTTSRQYRNRSTTYRSRRRGQSFKRGDQESAKPEDIYYVPPAIEKAADAPAISLSAASIQAESRSISPEHSEARKEEGETLAPEPQIDTPRKGRRTSSVKRPVSPGSGKPLSLPIFLWPIGQSSTINASKRAHKESSGDSTKAKHSLSAFGSFEVNDEILAKILDDADKQLKNSKKTNERKAYANVEIKSLQEVEDTMSRILAKGYTESRGNTILPTTHKIDTLMANIHSPNVFSVNGRERRIVELKKRILDSTKQLLHAFVPRNYRCCIIDKYWGAVCSVLQDSVIH